MTKCYFWICARDWSLSKAI